MPDHTPTNVETIRNVGDRLQDGTVCVAVDLGKNTALFAPAGIFGGTASFDDQDDIISKANKNALHGHTDWRKITDDEGATLAQVWDKVAPPELQGSTSPWFWLASPDANNLGRVRRGGESAVWGDTNRLNLIPVPCLRSGPARSS